MRLTITLISCILSLTCWARNDWYEQPVMLHSGIILVDMLPEPACEAVVHVRAAVSDANDEQWGVIWNYKDDSNYWSAIISLPKYDKHEDIIRAKSRVDIVCVDQGRETLSETISTDAIAVHNDFNSIKLIFAEGKVQIVIGNDISHDIGTYDCPYLCDAVAIYAKSDIRCQRVQVEVSEMLDAPISRFLSSDDLHKYLQRECEPIEGIWEYMDRNNDARKAVIGGRYELAIARNGDTFDIIYLSGAEINNHDWEPLQLKGRLIPTIFDGNYDMEWYDASHRLLHGDLNAQLSADGAILTLRFPELKTEIRLRHCR